MTVIRAAGILTPAEQLAVKTAEGQLRRGENPGINVTSALAITVRRLEAELATTYERGRRDGATLFALDRAIERAPAGMQKQDLTQLRDTVARNGAHPGGSS